MILRAYDTKDADELSALIRNCLRKKNIIDLDPLMIERMCAYYIPTNLNVLAKGRTMVVAVNTQGRIMWTVSLQGDTMMWLYVDSKYIVNGVKENLVTALEEHALEEEIDIMKTLVREQEVKYYNSLWYSKVRKHTSREFWTQIEMHKLLA